MSTIHRHDISDEAWELIKPHMLGQRGQWGGIAEDNRRFINAVIWILRTGAPWRDLPAEYGTPRFRSMTPPTPFPRHSFFASNISSVIKWIGLPGNVFIRSSNSFVSRQARDVKSLRFGILLLFLLFTADHYTFILSQKRTKIYFDFETFFDTFYSCVDAEKVSHTK